MKALFIAMVSALMLAGVSTSLAAYGANRFYGGGWDGYGQDGFTQAGGESSETVTLPTVIFKGGAGDGFDLAMADDLTYGVRGSMILLK